MLKLYSTGCPVCKIVIGVLNDNNIEFQEITDSEEVFEQADKYGIQNVPFAITDDGEVLETSIAIIDYAKQGN